MPQPWPRKLWLEHPTLHPILQLVQALREDQGVWTRPLVIAPDRKYSISGQTRILFYRRPARLFSKFEN